MIHPGTELRKVSEVVGYGVFATERIPKGTIVYAKDEMEIEYSPAQYEKLEPHYKAVVDRFSYLDAKGTRIVSWDNAKYVNHCCKANTMTTGYGFEIAIRDIEAGEEITDEYGIFNMDQELQLVCSKTDCRGTVCKKDFDRLHPVWDKAIQEALMSFDKVKQPLLVFLNKKDRSALEEYITTGKEYRSVLTQRLVPRGEGPMLKSTKKKSKSASDQQVEAV